MPCELCHHFLGPASNYEEIAINVERHGALYQCRRCGGFLELIAEERSVRFTPMDELKRFYPKAFENER